MSNNVDNINYVGNIAQLNAKRPGENYNNYESETFPKKLENKNEENLTFPKNSENNYLNPKNSENNITDPSNLKQLIESEQADIGETFQYERSVFTLFKIDGVIVSRVRNLDTGEVEYFPSLDTFSYNEDVAVDIGKIITAEG